MLYREAHILLEEMTEASVEGTRKAPLFELTTVPLLIIDDLGMRKLPTRTRVAAPIGGTHSWARNACTASPTASYREPACTSTRCLVPRSSVRETVQRPGAMASLQHFRVSRQAPGRPRGL